MRQAQLLRVRTVLAHQQPLRQPPRQKELTLAAEHASQCDLMLVLGSSLVVNPAASLVGLAIRRGARVALVNRGETPYDEAVALRPFPPES